MSEHKAFKANEKAAFTISTKLSTLGVMGHIMSDQTQRASLDTLAKVAKVLPDATTCPSYSDGLSCFISSSLMTTPYDVEAPWPHEIMESFMEAGLLHMTGTGTQSVLKMPNLSGLVFEYTFDMMKATIQKPIKSKTKSRKGNL